MRLHLLSVPLAASLVACQHAGSLASLGSPSAGLIQKLVEKEHAISLHNGHAVEQATVFSAGEQMSYKVSDVRCSPVENARFDCRFTLTRSLGSDDSTDTERRLVWRQPQVGWTNNAIEELCSRQKQALGTADCVGIVDR